MVSGISASVASKAAALTQSDYSVEYDGANFIVTRLSDKQETVINPSLIEVTERIRTGAFDYVLLKPADAQFLVSTTSFNLLRFADGRDHDPLSLLFAVDAFPPATFDVVMTGWVPTLNLTAYLRAVPAPGPSPPARTVMPSRIVEPGT